jgi:hypothetical protein
MFTYSYHFTLAKLFLSYLKAFYITFVFRIFCHSFWKKWKIKVTYISFISLKKWICFEKSIKFVSSCLSLQKNILTIFWTYLFNFVSYCKRQNSFSSSKLYINKFIGYKSKVICFLSYQVGLHMIIRFVC